MFISYLWKCESFTFLWTRLHDSFGTYKSYYEMLKQLQKLLRWSQNRLQSKPKETRYHQGIERQILTWNVLKRKRKQVRFWWQSLGTCGKNTLNLKYNLLVITGKGFISLQSCKLVLHCLGYDGIQYSLRALSCEWDLAELLIIFMKVKWKNNFQIRLPCTG